MKNKEELRGLTAEKLLQEIKSAQKALLEVRIRLSANQEKDTSKRGKYRKYVALLKTVLKEKKKTQETQKTTV